MNFTINHSLQTVNYDRVLEDILTSAQKYYHNQFMILLIFIVLLYFMIDQRKIVQSKLKMFFPNEYPYGLFKKRMIDYIDIYYMIIQLMTAILFIVITTLLFAGFSYADFNL